MEFRGFIGKSVVSDDDAYDDDYGSHWQYSAIYYYHWLIVQHTISRRL